MSDELLVATRKGLFHVGRGSGGWKVARASFVGDNVNLVLPDARDGTWYASLDHGHFGVKMHRSRDKGATWEECAVPAYAEAPEGEGGEKGPSVKLVWALAAGGPGQEGRLWAGTVPGGLFRSDDGADSWELVETLWNHPSRESWFGGGMDQPGIHSICVDPRDSDRVGVGVSCAGYWVTADGGRTWANKSQGMRAEYMPEERAFDPEVQDPHCIVQCADAPDVLWCQHHNGVFRSTDNSESWTEIEKVPPSVFGFPVAVHPHDPETAWLVPAVKDEKRIPVDGRVVVARTRDGGASFEELRAGLPQEHAYDITYRHALDVDAKGERLAFGSTTGSLWVSENQGDSWELVSSHLPPVYAVRFCQG